MLSGEAVDRLIVAKFHTKPHDNLPYTGWNPTTREDIVDICAAAGFSYGAEIGVAEARFSMVLCGKIAGLRLLCVDPFLAYDRVSQSLCNQRRRRAHRRLKPYNVEFMELPSMEAVRLVPEGALDFVYIDGDHKFDAVMMDVIEWSKRVRSGGIVAGHDFYPFYQSGVCEAVRVYTDRHNITRWYITRADAEPSYLWVKP